MPTTLARNVGRYLSAARKNAGMSQGDVSATLDVSQQLVSAWEQGAVVPSLQHLIRLADLYGFDMNELKVAA